MRCVLLLLLLVAGGAFFLAPGVSSLPTVSAEEESLFQSWMKKYNKKYDSSEYGRRLHIFLENKRMIDKHNAGNYSFKMGLNQFSDMSFDEFKKTYLMRTPQVEEKSSPHQ
ncbi:pro-cathepsin H-like [Trichosurus vulpecula]|uniref:pro-cathepsin H-like n=1 Tax=Trichosurus vulpecula TaxID=9337 RepID=UPI00186B1777|nr:pro-cathepsin H-like [Trichosurus vulpecula]